MKESIREEMEKWKASNNVFGSKVYRVESNEMDVAAFDPIQAECLAADLNELETLRDNIKTIEYKGYIAQLEIDLEDEIIVGRVINTEDVIAFHGYTVAGVKGIFADCIEGYFGNCAEMGVEPNKPRSEV